MTNSASSNPSTEDPLSSSERCARAVSALEARGRDLRAIEAIIPGSTESSALSDQRHREGRSLGEIDGLPFAVKANIDVEGIPTTSGLVDPDRMPAVSDAFVVERLRQCGAIPVATTTMAPMAMGATTEHPDLGPCLNPHDVRLHAGGSSGGSGALVGAGILPFALGSDTMGSVRIPAAYCHAFAWLPTHGSVSSRGMIPLAEPLDNVGVIASSARVLRQVAACIQTPDPLDSWAAHHETPGTRTNVRPTIATCSWISRADENRQSVTDEGLARLEQLGCRAIEDVDMSPLDPALLRRRGLALVEAAAAATFASEFDRGLIPAQWVGLIEYGHRMTAPYLWRVIRELVAARRVIRNLLRSVDILLLPTTPTAAPEVGTDPADAADLTAWVNIAGLPAVAVPWMGVSLQLIGRPGSDDFLLHWAEIFTNGPTSSAR